MPNQDSSNRPRNPITAFSAGAQSVTPDTITEDFKPPGSVLHTVTTANDPDNSVKKKAVITLAGAIVLIGGVSAGVALVGRDQDIRRSAQTTQAPQVEPSFFNFGRIVLYDTDWNELSPQALSGISAGDQIRVATSGSTNGGEISKARFTINGELHPETNTLVPGTQMYYYEFRVPADTQEIVVSAELHVDGHGWIK